MKPIKFTKFGANTAIGGFGPGDIARVSDALAQHLVDEAGVAKYIEAAAPATPPPTPAEPATVPEARKRGRAK